MADMQKSVTTKQSEAAKSLPPVHDYNWDNRCPVCLQDDPDIYEFTRGNSGEPSPDEASCGDCDWFFVETSQHVPLISDINDYRNKLIVELRRRAEYLESVTGLQPSKPESQTNGHDEAQK